MLLLFLAYLMILCLNHKLMRILLIQTEHYLTVSILTNGASGMKKERLADCVLHFSGESSLSNC